MLNRQCKAAASLLAFCLTVLLLTGTLFPDIACAQNTASTIDKKIRKGKQKATEINKEIRAKKAKIKEAIKKETSILSEIEDMEKHINEKQRELQALERRIAQAQSKILLLSGEMNQLTEKLNKRERYLERRLRSLYKRRFGDNVLILVSASDYHDLIRKSRYISILAFQDNQIMKKYRIELEGINSRKKEIEAIQARLEKNKESARQRKAEMETSLAKKDVLLNAIRSKRSSYEKAIAELEVSSRKLMEMIDSLEQMKIPGIDPGAGFTKFRGRLPWPVEGRVIVPFGKYMDPEFNIAVFKNGIELRTNPDDTPRAIAGGRVVYADWFKGYGLLLIINHGDGYHSLYGNLSEIFNQSGDIIRQGTAIGKVGVSRMLNVPSLYFEIRHKGKPVNPAIWLKKKGRSPKSK